MTKTPNPKRSAGQRLDDLENAMLSSLQAVDQMAKESQVIKEAVKLLGNKLDATIKVAGEKGITINDDEIAAKMVENNAADLKARVTGLCDNGVLTAQDTISDTSFVVGREVDSTGKVVNPRLQFAVKAVPEAYQAILAGKKAGDLVVFEEGKLSFEVLESYEIRSPQQPEQTAEV